MLKRYIVILLFSILVVIFAVQNVDKVAVQLWMLSFDASLSLIIILTLALGALITLLFTFREIKIRDREIRDLSQRLEKYEADEAAEETGFEDSSSRDF